MENKSPIGIIGAMEVEVNSIISRLSGEQSESIAGLVFHSGTLEEVPVVVAQCGPGKVNAAVCTQIMILKYSPRLIINTGVAGGVGVKIGDLVAAERCVQHDFDTRALGDKLGTLFIRRGDSETENILELPCDRTAAKVLLEEAKAIYGGAHMGVVATGDEFVADKEKNRWLGEQFGAKAVEMEGGSIAQACYMNGVPCAVLRAISDSANDDSPVDFPAFVRETAEKSAELLIRAMQKL